MDGVLYIMQSGDKYVYKYNFTRNNYYCIWTIVIVIMYLTDTTHLIILDTPIHVYMYMYMYMTTCTVHVITIILSYMCDGDGSFASDSLWASLLILQCTCTYTCT